MPTTCGSPISIQFLALNRAGFAGGLFWSVTRPWVQFPEPYRVGFGFCERDVPYRIEEPPVVEPVEPFKRGIFDSLEAAPWAATVDDLSLEQTIDRRGQGVVATVADAAHRGFDPGLPQTFSEVPLVS